MENSVICRLEKAAAQFPDKTVFRDCNSSLTFKRFNEITKSIGTYISGLSAPGNPVAVMSGRHSLTPACFLGIVRAGCFYAPMDGDMPDNRLRQMLDVVKAEILLADKAHAETAEKLGFKGKLVILEDIIDTEANEGLLSKRASAITNSSPLYVIFTSGSSGTPKGVITSHLSLMTYIDSVAKVLGVDENDVFGNQSPLDYIAAVRDIYLPLSFGASTYIIPKNEFAIPTALIDTLNREKITSLCWSAAGVELVAKLNAFDEAKPLYLKKLCFSGSVIAGKYLKIWQEALPELLLVNQYGPTEATASCTYYIINEKVCENTILPIGKPYENYKIFLLNDDNTPTLPGDVGQICVSGPIIALGYYGNDEATNASFVQNPLNLNYREIIYKTGDLGRWNENGDLEFHGRMDRQIKHMGHRIELGEIEDTASKIDGVDECCSLYQKEKELLYLFYSGTAISKEIVLKFRADMPAFMVPRKILKLDKLPKLPNGKTDMQALKQLFK